MRPSKISPVMSPRGQSAVKFVVVADAAVVVDVIGTGIVGT